MQFKSTSSIKIVYLLAVIPVIVPGLGLSQIALAHGTIRSFEAEVDGYFVDIGVDRPAFRAGEPVLLDFNLLSVETLHPVVFDNVIVRMTPQSSDKPVFAANIERAAVGSTQITYTFPEGGSYAMAVIFQSEGLSLAQTSFAFPVEEAALAPPYMLVFATLGFGLLAGVLLAKIFGLKSGS
jgi:hypothetical protein